MEIFHTLLRFLHVTAFAAWFGSVLASIYFLKSIEEKLTGNAINTSEYTSLLQRYIKLETKVADTGFKTVIITGILLAALYHGWTLWVFVKIGLIVLQVALTLGYITRSIRTLSYPCSPANYKRWYRLFTISLTMFALVLTISFFLL
ncbi:MAG: hypothetical protein FDX21_07675 [Chlorobium sp.]|nr:MAG: hypothetical protein FDX21_07675 [Chlorobium sp.]